MALRTRYGSTRRAGTGTQRRWGRRVRKQARKEIVRMAEAKRAFVFNEAWNYQGAMGVGTNLDDYYIANVFGYLSLGTGDTQFIGNQITDPLAVFKLSVQIQWASLASQVPNYTPAVRCDVYLIAVNDQFPTTVTPRATSIPEDSTLMMKPITFGGRVTWTHTLNGQSVRVIKKKTLKIYSPNQPTVMTTHNLTVKKKFKGHKTFETTFDPATGVQTQTTFLRGWNYYWYVLTAPNVVTAVNAIANNPIQVVADRYMYFKDF